MRVFGNIPIWGKLGVGFGLVTIILVIQGLVQLTALDRLATFQEEAAKRAADAREMAAIEQRVTSLYIIAAEAIIHDDVGGVKRGLMEFKVQAAKDMGRVRDLVDTDAERRLSEAFVASYGDYLRIVETELFAYREKGGADPTRIHEIDEAIDAVRDASLAPLAKIRDSLIGESDQAAAAFRDESGRAVASLWVLGACGVALALLSGLGISLLIARPLARLAVFAREISQGVIDRDLPIRQADEVGQVAWALRRVTESLRAVLSGFEETAGSLSRGRLLERGDPSRHKGAFARLMTEANGLADLLTRFLDFIPMPLMTMDADLSILFINKAGAGFVKADRAALIGRPRDAVLRTGDRQGQDRASAKAMRTLAEASGETVARLDAGERDIAYSAAPILDQAGRPVGVLEVVTDMTRIKTAQRKMVTLAGEAEDISSRLSRAAEELSVQVGQSSRGAETQRQRAAETATAMEEMNATVMEVAKNAAEAAGFADRTRERAARGADIVARAVTAIGTVQERTSLLRSNMHDLGDKAGAIGSVLTVISDIADQTNLLALNAAIEAARAGDAGRGFAVVADEVRKLAEKTMSATSEVGQAIASIQEAARDNITETDAAAKAVTESAELAEASGQALSEIVTMAEGTADQVRAIATASEQQSAASEEINRATEEINAVSGETMVAMERSDRAVRELAGLVGDLARLIGEMNEGTGEKGPPALEP